MPVADFFGDGTGVMTGCFRSRRIGYGRPDDLKALVDAAHAHGLMVFLDVVYNGFGPEGFHRTLRTGIFRVRDANPWGAAIDFGVCEVRAFVVENVLHWLDSHRFDGVPR